MLLFGLDGDFYNAGDLIAQLALDIIGAEGFDRLADQLGLGDVEAVLGLDGVGDLLGGDAAEELFTGAGLGGDGDRALLELGGQGQSGLFFCGLRSRRALSSSFWVLMLSAVAVTASLRGSRKFRA